MKNFNNNYAHIVQADNQAKTLTPDSLKNLTYSTGYKSFASRQLVITLDEDKEFIFYGSLNDQYFLPNFTLQKADGANFAFTPANPADAVSQFKEAVEKGFIYFKKLYT